MNLDDFRTLAEKTKQEHPIWFELESDPQASDAEIAAAESALGCEFPNAYKEFVKEFGGGLFAFSNVFSMSEDSYWYVVLKNQREGWPRDVPFLAVSENGTGDYYGFRVQDGRCAPEVAFYDHDDGGVKPTEFPDFFEYVVSTGFSY